MHTLYMNFLCQAIFIITCTFSTCTENKKGFHYRVEASDVDFLYWQVDKIALRADTRSAYSSGFHWLSLR